MSDRYRVFVFGSNLAGIHGAGAALHAKIHYGARSLAGVGHFGNSYALPTKDRNIRTLSLATIQKYVDEFLIYALTRKDLQFNVTQIGCGLAGYKPEQIAPMFCDGSNIWYDPFWEPWIRSKMFWKGPL